MTAGVRARRVRPVSPSKRTTLLLSLDLASEPIEGEVHEPRGPAHPFIGWLGLVGALEQAVRDAGGEPTNEEEDHHVP